MSKRGSQSFRTAALIGATVTFFFLAAPAVLALTDCPTQNPNGSIQCTSPNYWCGGTCQPQPATCPIIGAGDPLGVKTERDTEPGRYCAICACVCPPSKPNDCISSNQRCQATNGTCAAQGRASVCSTVPGAETQACGACLGGYVLAPDGTCTDKYIFSNPSSGTQPISSLVSGDFSIAGNAGTGLGNLKLVAPNVGANSGNIYMQSGKAIHVDNTAAAATSLNIGNWYGGSATYDADLNLYGSFAARDLSIGTTTALTVSTAGDLSKIKGVSYSWPAANAVGALRNDGLGVLTWSDLGPGAGIDGYWNRSGNTIRPAYSNDLVSVTSTSGPALSGITSAVNTPAIWANNTIGGSGYGVYAQAYNSFYSIANGGYGLYTQGGNTGVYSTASQYGVYGSGNYGVYGLGTYGVYGQGTYGVYGVGSGNYAIYGSNSSSGTLGYIAGGTTQPYGFFGQGGSVGVYGTASGANTGVYGNGGTGVQAQGTSYGVYSTSGNTAVYGTGTNYGLFGSSANYAVYGSGGSYGVYGSGTTYGIYGSSAATAVRGSGGTTGVSGGGSNYGLYGIGGTYGVYGNGTYGVYGTGTTYGVYGVAAANGTGVYASTSGSGQAVSANGGFYGVYSTGSSYGVYGLGGAQAGVYGRGTAAGVNGVLGESTLSAAPAVYGYNNSGIGGSIGVYGNTGSLTIGTGVSGQGANGVYGYSGSSSGAGVYGQNSAANGPAVYGYSTAANSTGVFGNAALYGVYGQGQYGVYGSGSTYGGYFYTSGANIGVYAYSNGGRAAHLQSTGEQLRLDNNVSNFTTLTTNGSGDLTITPSGGDVIVPGTVTMNVAKIVTGAAAGNVLTAKDATGLAEWKSAVFANECTGGKFDHLSVDGSGNPATYNGNQTSYAVANTKCGGSTHVCTPDEIMRTVVCAPATLPGSGNAWVNNGPPGFTSPAANDCNGWSTNSGSNYGTFWQFGGTGGGKGFATSCSLSLRFACCTSTAP